MAVVVATTKFSDGAYLPIIVVPGVIWAFKAIRRHYDRIDRALAQLSYEHRTVLVLHEFEEMEYKTIAKTMGCSIGTVMSRLFYARRKLAALLADMRKAS